MSDDKIEELVQTNDQSIYDPSKDPQIATRGIRAVIYNASRPGKSSA
jgi:hypothetical protein